MLLILCTADTQASPDHTPNAIQHISDAIVCVSDHGLQVQEKSGGHSYAGFSNRATNGSVVIYLNGFQGVSVLGSTILFRYSEFLL